jgi:hypothetical protein
VAGRLELLHAFGQTASGDATIEAVRLLGNAAYASRAIVLITDGIDNVSTTDEDTVIRAIRQNGIAIYAIGIGNPNAPSSPIFSNQPGLNGMDVSTLQSFALESAGHSWIVNTGAQSPETQFGAALRFIEQSIARQSYSVGVILPPPIARDQGRRFKNQRTADGLQAARDGTAALAPPRWHSAIAGGSCRNKIRGWSSGRC